MSEEPSGSSVPRRQLGTLLRTARERQGITMDYACQQIQRSRPTLWKLESGRPQVTVRSLDILLLCELYRSSPAETAQLLALAEATRVKGWTASYASIMPPSLDMYLDLEATADHLSWFEDRLLPPILQTEDYARTVIAFGHPGVEPPDAEELEHRVSVLAGRGRLLTRFPQPAPHFAAILTEPVIRRAVGGADVLRAQLRRLVDLGDRTNVSIRVLPDGTGLHCGVFSGPFSLLRFPEGKGAPVVCADGGDRTPWFRDKPAEIVRYQQVLDEIGGHALDEDASRRLLLGLAGDRPTADPK